MTNIKKGWKDTSIVKAFNSILNKEVLNEEMSETEALDALETHQNEVTSQTTTETAPVGEAQNTEAITETETTPEGEGEESTVTAQNVDLASQIADVNNTVLELAKTTFAALNELQNSINQIIANNASVKSETANAINQIKGLKSVQPSKSDNITTPKIGSGEDVNKGRKVVKADFLDTWETGTAANN